MALDPISSVADAVSSLASLIASESALTHPLLYMWRISRMINRLTKECENNNTIVPDDLVHACCHDLDVQEQEFILHVVQEKLKLVK